MAHPRTPSTVDGLKEPHSVSLKVLRLSRPSLSIQHPLPTPSPSPSSEDALYPSRAASLAYPSSKPEDNFILSPLLTLPPAFGSAYSGETFSCTLCANNELLPSSTPSKTISNVRIEAEMKIPSSPTPLPLELGPPAEQKEGAGEALAPGHSLQKVVSFELKEEGSHVLAVTVTYSETTPTSGRIRTFRKLYQFVCKGCMVVRTKTGVLPPGPALKLEDGDEGSRRRRWALEAQLENCGEDIITLDKVILETKEGFKSTGLNWEPISAGESGIERPVLNPGDVQQVCFMVEEVATVEESEDGRLIFGILSLSWRGNMGNRGFLSTGNLGTRLK